MITPVNAYVKTLVNTPVNSIVNTHVNPFPPPLNLLIMQSVFFYKHGPIILRQYFARN